jgi:lipopolysaccharide biosynthesis regulator YciM
MGNPMWVAGGKSANPTGRPKASVRTIKGMVERFVRRNITPNKLQKMYATLSVKEQMEMLMHLLPYAIAKQSPEGISSEEVDRLYHMVEEALKAKQHGQTAG